MTTKVLGRRAILEGLGRGGVASTTSAGSGGGSTLVCTDFKSTILPTDHFDRVWFHVPTATAPRQRRGATNALTVASGTITFDDVMGSQIGTSTTFEWCPLLPIVNGAAMGAGPSIEHCFYEALRHLVFQDEVTIAVVADQDEYPLTTWAPWLDRSERLVKVLEPNPVSASRKPIDATWRGVTLVLDGETPRLRLDAPLRSATGNLTLRALRPADTWFKTSGTWVETAPGSVLAAETDEVKPDLRHMREAGLVFALQTLAATREGPRRAEYQAMYERQLGIARALPFWDATRDDLLPRPNSGAQAAPMAEAA